MAANLEVIDHLDQIRLYKLIQNSIGGVILSGSTRYWWANFAKLVDYIGLKKPVFAVVPQLSESRRVLSEAKLGIFLDGNPSEDIEILVRAINTRNAGIIADQNVCKEYLASQMADSFNSIFETLL